MRLDKLLRSVLQNSGHEFYFDKVKCFLYMTRDIRKKLKDIFGKIGCSGTVLLRELKKLQGVMKLHKKDLSKENIPESKGNSK